jgi:AcrR family transcriptional regulator
MTAERSAEVIWMRPEHAGVGRPAQRSREQITAAAVAIADAGGLEAVSMRRVAAELGTGAASLYRYLDTREDLLDLMIDATGAEYVLAAPTGDWLADLVGIGQQARRIMRRHPWLPALVIGRAVLGPHGLVLIEHFLDILAAHPADIGAKLEAFGMLNALAAVFVQNELTGGSAQQERNAAYLQHVLAAGELPRLAVLLTAGPAAPPPEPPEPPDPADPADPGDRFADLLRKIATGLLQPAPPREA